MQLIPLDNSPNQNFDITLEYNGKNVIYNLYLSYNPDNYWTIQMRNSSKKPITDCIPLLSGENLLQGLEYLDLGELYLLPKSNVNQEVPDIYNIESDYYLVWRGNDLQS